MAVQFILGRSGTGKTSHCVRAIVDALREPSDRPLLFLVPEQATYQAERAILSDPAIQGFHRLHILSFDRLQFLLLGQTTARPSVSRIGRQMMVHKILRDNLDKLQIFGGSALQPGFAREMANTITELHQYAKSPEEIEGLLERLEHEGAARNLQPPAFGLPTAEATDSLRSSSQISHWSSAGTRSCCRIVSSIPTPRSQPPAEACPGRRSSRGLTCGWMVSRPSREARWPS